MQLASKACDINKDNRVYASAIRGSLCYLTSITIAICLIKNANTRALICTAVPASARRHNHNKVTF